MDETTRLSECELWTRQSAFYQERGPDAWAGATLPLYITSNPTFVRAYAEVIRAYWRDVADLCDPSLPLYVVDLGCGAGRFTFALLRELAGTDPDHAPAARIVVVGADVVPQNLEALRQHPMLRDAFEAGLLDLALFDALGDRELTLQLSGARLGPDRPANPIVFTANYLFDSLPCDMFRVLGGVLQERRVRVSAEPVPIDDEWSGIAVVDQPLEHPYYDDPDLEEVLQRFAGWGRDGYFSVPTVGIGCWKNLDRLSGSRMLMLSADKGGATPEMALGERANAIQHHGDGCISVTVNYRALGDVVERHGGAVLAREEESSPLSIVGLLSGVAERQFPRTHAGFRRQIDGFGPEGFFHTKCVLEEIYDEMNLQSLIAWLRLSDGDPIILLQMAAALQKQAENATPSEKRALEKLAERSWSHYFPVGESLDLPFQLGRLLLELGNAERALFFFERSVELHGPHPSALCNISLAQLEGGDPQAALATLEDAIERHPHIAEAKMVNLLLYRISTTLDGAES